MHEYDPADLITGCADFMGANAIELETHALVVHAIDYWLAAHDLHRRWDMIDVAALADSLEGTVAERMRFWLGMTAVLMYMTEAGLLSRRRVYQYFDGILEAAPDRPKLRSLLCAARAAVRDMPLH